MAHQASALPAGSMSQCYDPIPVVRDPLLRRNEKDVTSAATTTISSRNSKSFAQSWSAGQVLLTAAIPLVALIVWLSCVQANPHIFDTFAGERIGGRFSQAEAKAIDVITGAILAPLFMAALNHIWFDSARVSAVNEQEQKAIPLRTLVAVSGTSAGNYDFFLLRDLFQGRTWRLFLLGLLTLLSAVSRTALSNIIAYEAYTEENPSGDLITLRLQRYHAIEEDRGIIDYTELNLYDFSPTQNAEVAKEVAALLTDLSFEVPLVKLSENTYVGINATTRSLDSLPQSIVELHNVPAYRLSVACMPDLPNHVTVSQPLTDLNTQISLNFNATAVSDAFLFQANYPGVPANIQTGDGDRYSYAAFAFPNYQEVYLGHLNRFDLSNETILSTFGNVRFRAFNMTKDGFTATQGVMSISGIRCLLYQEHGLLNSTRVPSNKSSVGTWAISSTNFPDAPDNQEKKFVASKLSKFQWSSLNFHAPGSTIPGLGPALSGYGKVTHGEPGLPDLFTEFALNFLYASGEAQRIVYEVAASSTNASHNLPEYFVNVTAFATQQHYRVTYVPSILLLGLLCLIGASVVTGAMAAYTRNAVSARAHRQVNLVRLLVDGVLGLVDHKEDIARAAQSGNKDLDAWAAGYKVRYTSVDDEEGTVRIVLEKIEG